MKALLFATLFILIYLGTLLANAPAEQLLQLATRMGLQLPQQVELHRIEGTLWGGEGALSITVPGQPFNDASSATDAGPTYTIEQLHWRWEPSGLLSAQWRYQIDLELDGGSAKGQVGVTPGGEIRAQELVAQLSAQRLGQLWEQQLEGELYLVAERLAWHPEGLPRIDGRLNWEATGFRPPGRLPPVRLGNLALTLTMVEDGSDGVLNDGGDGPLEIAGQLSLRQPDRIEIGAHVKARPEAPRDMVEALQFIGEPHDSGGVTLSWSLAELGSEAEDASP